MLEVPDEYPISLKTTPENSLKLEYGKPHHRNELLPSTEQKWCALAQYSTPKSSSWYAPGLAWGHANHPDQHQWMRHATSGSDCWWPLPGLPETEENSMLPLHTAAAAPEQHAWRLTGIDGIAAIRPLQLLVLFLRRVKALVVQRLQHARKVCRALQARSRIGQHYHVR
jgi:hypothetical protein